jgi:hypothetical protein
MIAKNITRRLERLEDATMPAGEPKVWQIIIVNSDGSRTEGATITWYPHAPGNRPDQKRYR